jgi:hypothetical protein
MYSWRRELSQQQILVAPNKTIRMVWTEPLENLEFINNELFMEKKKSRGKAIQLDLNALELWIHITVTEVVQSLFDLASATSNNQDGESCSSERNTNTAY